MVSVWELSLMVALPVYLSMRWIYRLGMAVRYGARDPLLIESSTPEKVGLTFAIYELSDCIGSFLGPLFPILIFGVFGQSLRVIRSLFSLSVIPNLIAIMIITKYVAETIRPEKNTKKNIAFMEKLRVVVKNKNLVIFTAITSISTLFALTVDLELLYLTFGSVKADALFSSIMFSFWTATTAVAAIPAGRLSDKVGRKLAIILAFTFHATSMIIILFYHFVLPNLFLLPIAFISLGLYDTFFNVSSKTFVADNASMENRGMIMGLYTTIDGVSRRAIAPIIAGFIFSTSSYATSFILGFAFSILAIFLILPMVSES